MGAWSRFLDAFFNWRLIERYSPDILKGTVVTIEIAVAVVISGNAPRRRRLASTRGRHEKMARRLTLPTRFVSQ